MRIPSLQGHPEELAQSLISERYRGECCGLRGYPRTHNKFESHYLDRAWLSFS